MKEKDEDKVMFTSVKQIKIPVRDACLIHTNCGATSLQLQLFRNLTLKA